MVMGSNDAHGICDDQCVCMIHDRACHAMHDDPDSQEQRGGPHIFSMIRKCTTIIVGPDAGRHVIAVAQR